MTNRGQTMIPVAFVGRKALRGTDVDGAPMLGRRSRRFDDRIRRARDRAVPPQAAADLGQFRRLLEPELIAFLRVWTHSPAKRGRPTE